MFKIIKLDAIICEDYISYHFYKIDFDKS
jgi:hypothetical protein